MLRIYSDIYCKPKLVDSFFVEKASVAIKFSTTCNFNENAILSPEAHLMMKMPISYLYKITLSALGRFMLVCC